MSIISHYEYLGWALSDEPNDERKRYLYLVTELRSFEYEEFTEYYVLGLVEEYRDERTLQEWGYDDIESEVWFTCSTDPETLRADALEIIKSSAIN